MPPLNIPVTLSGDSGMILAFYFNFSIIGKIYQAN